MTKKRINIVCAILFLSKAIECLTVSLCEDSRQGYANVSCPENKIISLKSIIYGELPCQDTRNSNICLSTINTYFNNQCLAQNSCTLPVATLSMNDCQRPPRRLIVDYTCKGNWYAHWIDKYTNPDYTADTCANTLLKVNCPTHYHIRINNASFYSEKSDCDIMNTGCAISILQLVKSLCDDKSRCLTVTNNLSCFFHERFASIYYICTGTTDLPATAITDHQVETTTMEAAIINYKSTGTPEICVTNHSSNEMVAVKSGFPTLAVAVGVPLGITGMICIIFAVVFIRRRSVHSKLVIENEEDRTRTGETSRILETGLYECTNVTDRSSDHTYDPLESEELNCQFIDSNSQNENKVSLTRNGERGTTPENYFYESTHVVSRLSDHTYDPIESAEYYNITNVSASSAK